MNDATDAAQLMAKIDHVSGLSINPDASGYSFPLQTAQQDKLLSPTEVGLSLSLPFLCQARRLEEHSLTRDTAHPQATARLSQPLTFPPLQQ